MSDAAMRGKYGRWARWLFWVSFGLLILPGLAAIALVLVIKGSCPLDGSASMLCRRLGQILHQTFQHNLTILTWSIYSLGLPLWILLALLHRSFKGWTRILMAVGCIWGIPHSYSILGTIAAALLADGVCRLPGECLILGINMGTTLFSQGTSLWFLFLTLPICSIATLIYPGILFIRMSQQADRRQ